MKKKIDLFQQAKDYAFLLLRFRPRTEKEISQRLKKKGFSEEVIEKILVFLRKNNFINDASFAQAWIESRLKKPLGINRIKQELILKGIDKAIIDSKINEILKDYSEEKIVTEIARKRFKRLENLPIDKTKRRIYDYLLRRGFSQEIVNDVISRLLD
ncbi:MAG: recombination regulator RecX [Candidatus Omnitrophica bacterium]|nr:recombination regulator RecX [Candidatus Omnitrophota bacterium]